MVSSISHLSLMFSFLILIFFDHNVESELIQPRSGGHFGSPRFQPGVKERQEITGRGNILEEVP